MIVFFRADDCRECDAIEEALADLVLAHRVVRFAGDPPYEGLPAGLSPPVLADGGHWFAGGQEIRRHLDELGEFKAEWDKFQSDACYCDDQGNVI